MVVTRQAEKRLKYLARTFRAVAVIGPRQSGKTTLCKMAFPKKPYVSLENPTTLQFAQTDPVGFLAQYPKGAVIDEAQRMPQLFSYLQQLLDETKNPGLFILTGSNNFLIQQNITQSLAGRIGYLTLLPFSIAELSANKLLKTRWPENVVRGFYPEIIVKKIKPDVWYNAYSKTYIERDVRQLKNIANLSLFTKFIYLCAGRAAQILNINSLANDCGIDNKTAQSWLGILESSFVVFQLKPYFKNFNKQISKSSKLYFYDTGLLCYLLHISNGKELAGSMYKGPVFENFIICEKIKQKENTGHTHDFYYWRDKTGNEVDLITDNHKTISIAEIKSAETINPSFWKTLLYFETLFGKPLEKCVYYGGEESQKRSKNLSITGWQNLHE
ncbi:MAG TPA: ATP-binding protein [Ferruginibacter sp.]|nr:ATP-binding protein [Ferruginibacter sp.]